MRLQPKCVYTFILKKKGSIFCISSLSDGKGCMRPDKLCVYVYSVYIYAHTV
jgi:hypothetical protein